MLSALPPSEVAVTNGEKKEDHPQGNGRQQEERPIGGGDRPEEGGRRKRRATRGEKRTTEIPFYYQIDFQNIVALGQRIRRILLVAIQLAGSLIVVSLCAVTKPIE